MTAYSYPLCCGVPTELRYNGWYCTVCEQLHDFRDDEGRTWQQQQQMLYKKAAEQKKTPKKKSIR